MSESFYLGVKSLHVIAIISWMAGLLYLPRLFVYHIENKEENSIYSLFLIMERLLYLFIMTPAMLISWMTGLIMMISASWYQAGWMHFKLLLVLLLTLCHFYFGYYRKAFIAGTVQKNSKFFRFINEIPTILMIGIVILVVYKAF